LRFAANGVDASDVAEIAASLRHFDDWCAAWSLLGERHEELGRRALEEGRSRTAGEQLAQAATCYHFAKFLFVHELEQMREAHRRAVRCLADAMPLLDPPARREEISFEGGRLVGVLRLPRGQGPHPLVILVPGLDSTKEELRSVEGSFLDRGVGTLAVDGPGQGECEEEFPIRPDWEVPGKALVDHLCCLEEVDEDRIGVWGVSLGGYYACRIAAGDARVRALAVLSGPFDFGKAWDRLPALSRAAFELRSHARDAAQARQRAQELTLSGTARMIACPLLVVFGKQDRLFSWQDGLRLSKEVAGPSELLLLEDANHGCTNGIYRHRPYTADWMARQLSAPGAPGASS
jgi:dienelactone hydrolase